VTLPSPPVPYPLPPLPVPEPPEPVVFRTGALQENDTTAENAITERSEKKRRYNIK
jgi:hypothetical protein